VSKRSKASPNSFDEAIQSLREVASGQEAAMYGPIRDIFCDILGYPRPKVVIDIAGESGRPDVTCRAPNGLTDRFGKSVDIDWIVVEAKAELNAFSSEHKRESIFSQKAKYIGPNTAWFVMVDPARFVARPTFTAELSSLNDVEFRLDGTETEDDFRRKFASLESARAGVPDRLKAFRDGDVSLIATEKLTVIPITSVRVENQVALARRNFYSALSLTTQALQDSTLQTLRTLKPELDRIVALGEEFRKKYNGCHFDPYSFRIVGQPNTYELTKSHAFDSARLTRIFKKAGTVARLALHEIPQFRGRSGADDEAQNFELFAIETANLILARILLIRFFEDHGFFGPHRYVCNGGILAFQKWREAFALGYTRLLKDAYEKAQRLYAAAFDETELDWIFGINDAGLSSAIEWAMYQLSRYDFATVRGDILTGVYDRFLDRDQRKRLGEYYTPPSIARYIIDHLGLAPNDMVLDAACGSGTFLIERYQQVVGEDADRGIATYREALKAIQGIAGNDLNTFSAVLAQIQLLWHLLIFRDDLMREVEFPDLAITSRADSLVRSQLEISNHFTELDRPIYGGVVGNPPYIRKERAGDIDKDTRAYFESSRSKPGNIGAWSGISAEANLYALFIYRALDSWCRPPDRWGRNAGKLGYVTPLALCGSNENSDLRALFGPNGRWTITEIVDLEVIWRYVFDADVLPILLMCEARPPRLPLDDKWLASDSPLPSDQVLSMQVRAARLHQWLLERFNSIQKRGESGRLRVYRALLERNLMRFAPDVVKIKIADKSCLSFYEGDKRPTFQLEEIRPTLVNYADLFTPDGRILTRLNENRIKIIRKLALNEKLEQAFQTYWYKRAGTDRGSTQIEKPTGPEQHWEQRQMVSRGVVFAGKKRFAKDGRGHTIYKAENILAGAIYGEPQDVNVDISSARNRYLFEFTNILPEKMYAVAMIATCLNAVEFNPHRIAFTDTATIFVPRSDLAEFPFDLLFISRVYRYYYALSCRMSYLNLYRSHVYPTNLRLMPWSDNLVLQAGRIEILRAALISTCEIAFNTRSAMLAELESLTLRSLAEVVRETSGAKITWSESFSKGVERIEIAETISVVPTEQGGRLQVSEYVFDWLEITSEEISKSVAAALQVRVGELVDRNDVLKLRIPVDQKARSAFSKIVARYTSVDHMTGIEAVIDDLDAIIIPALGLDNDDLSAIRKDMLEDPFLRNIIPRYPGTETRLHGYRTGLDSSERYD
jgi:N-6 DNA methylase